MREKVRTRQYVITLHAEEEMNDDDLSIFDVEHCIITGRIVDSGTSKEHNDGRMEVPYSRGSLRRE